MLSVGPAKIHSVLILHIQTIVLEKKWLQIATKDPSWHVGNRCRVNTTLTSWFCPMRMGCKVHAIPVSPSPLLFFHNHKRNLQSTAEGWVAVLVASVWGLQNYVVLHLVEVLNYTLILLGGLSLYTSLLGIPLEQSLQGPSVGLAIMNQLSAKLPGSLSLMSVIQRKTAMSLPGFFAFLAHSL